MAYERKEGKDTIIFLSKEELNEPAKVSLEYDKDDEEQMGLIRPDGAINWNCPCLQGMADGPCGPEFKQSFSCFHFSEADPKGADCIDQFRSMQECFVKYPEVYSFDDDKEASTEDTSKETEAIETSTKIEEPPEEKEENVAAEEAKELIDYSSSGSNEIAASVNNNDKNATE